MLHQNTPLTREELKSPSVLLFGAIYVFAIVLTLLSDPSQALLYIGMSLGVLMLGWFIFDLTSEFQVEDIQIGRPWLELAFGCLVYLVYEFTPYLGFGDKWALGEIIKKELVLVVIPLAFLRLRNNSFSSMGLSLSNWKQNLKIAGIVFACMAVPSAFLIGDAANQLLGGQLKLFQVVPGFSIYFIHNVVRSGLTEEFFFRALVQTRLSQVLKSRLGGIFIASLLFGLIHVPSLIQWYPEMTLSEAFCRALFIQGLTGIIFGAIWERTRSLIPGVIVHSGINTLNNLGSAVSLIFH